MKGFNKKMKSLSLALVVALVVGMIPSSVYAAEENNSVSDNAIVSEADGSIAGQNEEVTLDEEGSIADDIAWEATMSDEASVSDDEMSDESEAEEVTETVSEGDIMYGEMSVSYNATGSVAGYTPISSADFLKADGRNLKNAKGEVVNLRGTNAGGLGVQEFWMTPTAASANVADQDDIMRVLTQRFGAETMYELVDLYESTYWTEEDFKNIADMGLNCIRLPFWWRNIMDENGNWYGYNAQANDPYAKAFERIDWFVERASAYGLYVVLDIHGAPGSQNGSDHSGVDGGDTKQEASEFFFGNNAAANQELYYDMLEVIAARYAGNPAVAGYDLLNEPFCTYVKDEFHEMLWNIYDKAYDVVRSVDADHVVIMEAVWNADALPSPALYGWENVMYEYHNYNYGDYDNAAGTQITSMQGKLDNIKNADYDVPSYMGEFCFFNNPDAWDEGLELMTKAGINWTTWTYKTIAEYGMWGLYHHPANMNAGINIETATLDAIKEWWGKVDTASGEANTALITPVSKWAKAETYESTLGATSADIATDTYYFAANNTQNLLSVANDIVISKNVQTATDAEKFVLENEEGIIYVKSVSTGKYLVYNEADKTLKATGDKSQAEKFLINDYTLTAVTIKAKGVGLYVQENADNAAVTVIGSGKPMGAQTFQLYNATTNKVYNNDIVEEAKKAWKRIEAETATHKGGKLISDTQPNYSGANAWGGFDVRPNGFTGDWDSIDYVAFDLNAPVEGDYQVIATYNGNDDKVVFASLDKGAYMTLDIARDGSDTDWALKHEFIFTVHMTKGNHTLYLSAPEWTEAMSGAWLNYDCIDVSKYPVSEQDDGALRYEGEYFYSTGYETSGGSHYSNSQARGGFNQDITLSQFAADWSNVRFTEFNVYAKEAGTYTITFGYDGENANGMTVIYNVNNGENKELLVNAAGWSSSQMKKFDVELNKGFNSIKISGTIGNQSHWANCDYIDVILKGSEKAKAISGFTRYEGESATITKAEGSGAGIQQQEFYSGKYALDGFGNGNVNIDEAMTSFSGFSYATIKARVNYDGNYRIVIAYNGDDDKNMLVRANDNVQKLAVPAVRADHKWDEIHTVVCVVPLKSGMNTIDLSGALGGGWMNIDYVDISNYPISMNQDGSERYEAETFEVKSANKPAREHQDIYSGLDNLNGVGGMGATYTAYEVGGPILDTPLNYTDFSIFADKAGFYDITVMGNGAKANIECVYSVNGEASKTFVLPNNGFEWDHMVSKVIHVKLNKGYNDLLLAGSFSGSWLNYDYIDVVYSATQEEIEDEEPTEEPTIFTRYEAEAGVIVGGKAEAQGMYSGKGENGVGAMAGTDESFSVGDNIVGKNLKYITYTVNAEEAGKYIIMVAANGADKDMPVAYQVNGAPSKTFTIKNSAAGYSWDRMMLSTIVVDLNEGENEVIISGTYSYIQDAWLNYDYIDVAPISKTTDLATGNDRYEAEDFVLKGAVAEHQDMYSGSAANNGVGQLANSDDDFNIGDDIEASKLHYIEFAVITCKAGQYQVEVVANGADKAMPVAYQINDGASKTFTIDNTTDGYAWNRLVKTTVAMDLVEGYNKIVLAGTYSYIDGAWLNYDYIEVKNAHTVVVDDEVAATCTEAGLTQGAHCAECGEVLSKQEVVAALGHTIVIDPAVAATGTQTGLTQGSHCGVCGAVITAQQTVPVVSNTASTSQRTVAGVEKVSYIDTVNAADKKLLTSNVSNSVNKLLEKTPVATATKASINEMVESLLSDNKVSDLGLAMQSDDAVAAKIKEIEAKYISLNGITESIIVEDEVKDIVAADKISVIGLGLNALEGETIKLVFGKPAQDEVINTTIYKNPCQLSISSYAGVRNIKYLKAPMTITMAAPANLNAASLVILHFGGDGNYETVKPKVNADGTITFTVTSLSTFIFAEAAAVSPKTADVTGVIIYMALACAVIGCAVVYARKRRRA